MKSGDTRSPFLRDLKRMAPVWAIVVVTAIIVAITMREIGQAQLRQATALSRNACTYAEVLFNAGYQRMNSIRELAGERRLEGETLDEPALGILRGNERLHWVMERFERAVELCPSRHEAHRSLAVLKWYEGDASAAYYHLASWQMQTDRLAEAQIHYEMAREQDPENRQALMGLIECLLRMGRLADARAQIAGNEEELRRTPRGTLLLGEIYWREGQLEQAEEHLRAGLREYPVDRGAISNLYSLARRTGELRPTADFLFSLGDHHDRVATEAYDLAGGLYMELEDYRAAERAYRRALELFPNNVDILFSASVALYKQDKYAEARDTVRLAIEHDIGRVMRRIEQTGIDPR